MKNLFKIWRQTHKSMPFATHIAWTIKSAMLAGYFVLELVLAVLSPSLTDEINIFNMWLPLSPFCYVLPICFACFPSNIMAQKRLSDFFLSVSKQTRNENEDETVEQLEEKQDEKDKQEVEKGKQVKTTGMLRAVQQWLTSGKRLKRPEFMNWLVRERQVIQPLL